MSRKKTQFQVRRRPKVKCEIEECGVDDPALLEYHHIIERTEHDTTNDDFNIAVICANCHTKVHQGKLKILGVMRGTRPPTGRILVYELDGKKNVDIGDEYFEQLRPKPATMEWHEK